MTQKESIKAIIDEIKNEVKKTWDDIEWFNWTMTIEFFHEIIDKTLYRIEKEVPDNEWISVKEKEPEPDTNNLVCYYWFNKHILVAEASCDCERNWKDLDFFIWMNPVEITHWMPIPNPPITK